MDIAGNASIITSITTLMDVEKSAPQSQVYKNANWPERKKELKATRNQRTTKSIKNIRIIDTPCDSTFNCTYPLI